MLEVIAEMIAMEEITAIEEITIGEIVTDALKEGLFHIEVEDKKKKKTFLVIIYLNNA